MGEVEVGPELELLCELIRRPSVTPDDAGCQKLLAARLSQRGFRCESLRFGEVTNLWARRGTEAPLLCFAGHTDVVPPGDDAEWHTAPFEPVIEDGALFGRGAADMKSGLAAMVVAAEAFVEHNEAHKGSLAFLLTSDEEGPARDGTRRVVDELGLRGEQIDWCVIGEPSSRELLGDIVRIGRRGSLSGKITVRGVQGHVAYPQLADNPITRFAPVLAALHEVDWGDGNDYFPPSSFQVVDIRSHAPAVNVTPAELRARFNIRYSTEWSHEELQTLIENVLNEHDIDYSIDWHLSGKPFLTEPGVLIDAVSQAVCEHTGKQPELSTGGGTSDGRFISPYGADVVELGPVNATIHMVNEEVQVTDVAMLRSMYERIMELLLLEQR